MEYGPPVIVHWLKASYQRAQPLVRHTYGPRFLACTAAALAVVFVENRPLGAVDLAVMAYGLLAPHLFFWGSLRFANSGRAGRAAMYADSAYTGAVLGLYSESPIVVACGLVVIVTNPIVVGGVPFLLRNLVPLGLGFGAWKVLLPGHGPGTQISSLGTGIVVACVVVYVSMSANFTRRLTERIRGQRAELEARTRELEVTTRRLRDLDALKDEFLATTSHELRTPITGIMGLAEGLAAGAEGRVSPKVKERLELIVSAGRRLKDLVDNILEFSRNRAQAPVLQISEVDVISQIEQAIAIVRPLLGEKPVELSIQVDASIPTVLAEPQKLHQILVNLLANAVKFTHRGTIVLRVRQEGDRVQFCVQDTGIGVAAPMVARVFDPFVQGQAGDTRAYGGTGLGLAVVKRLVEAHGGGVSMESEEGKGTSVTFDLAAGNTALWSLGNNILVADQWSAPSANGAKSVGHKSSRGLIAVSESLAVKGTRPRVLIVDDEATNRAVLLTNLRSLDVEVDQAEDGIDALEKLARRGPYDLVVLDVMMPRMGGIEACKRMRQQYGLTELPIILLTAKNRVEDVVEGFDAGASDYVAKPFSRREILARVRTHLLVRRTARSMARFVPDAILGHLGRGNLLDVELGDSATKRLSVLFADIRGFTKLSERLGARATMTFVNRVFAKLGPCVRDHGGFVDKYVGDGIIGLFDKTPTDACSSAQAMLDGVAALREEETFRDLDVGIGIATGPVLLGTVGETKRFDATVLGDAVNLASRLESLTKMFGVPVLCCSRTLAEVGRKNYVELARVRVVGREAIETVGTLSSCFPVTQEVADRWRDITHIARSSAAFDPRFLQGLDPYRRLARLHQEHGQAHPDGGLFIAIDRK